MEESTLPWEAERKLIEDPVFRIKVTKIGLGEQEWAQEVVKYLDTRELLTKRKRQGRSQEELHSSLRPSRNSLHVGVFVPFIDVCLPIESSIRPSRDT